MTRNTAKQDALLDELLKNYADPKDILGKIGLCVSYVVSDPWSIPLKGKSDQHIFPSVWK